jgi:succinyl-diaminopimelate desuccinylase
VTQTSLPAYLLPGESPLPLALNRASKRILNRELPFAVTGPSNIGNLLAQRGIPATCGFGVAYRNIHAADECVDLASVTPTYRVYEAALQELLSMA